MMKYFKKVPQNAVNLLIFAEKSDKIVYGKNIYYIYLKGKKSVPNL